MKRAIRASGAAALVVAVAACGARQGADRAVGVQPAPANAVTVNVENHNWSDIVVYAVRGGRRYRLGTVTSMQSAEFMVPPGLLGGSADLRLMLDPIGSRHAFVTEQILVTPGDRVLFSVENYLPLSSWAVRR